MPISLTLLPDSYALCKVEQHSDLLPEMYESDFYALAESKDELSVFCKRIHVPAKCLAISENWRVLKFVGNLDDGHVGTVATITSPLAVAGISVLVYTTYDAGYFAVSAHSLDDSVRALHAAGVIM